MFPPSSRFLASRSWLLSLAVVCAVILGIFTTSTAPLAAPVRSHAHALTRVYVQLGWLKNVEFSSLWVADHLGWFRQAGIQLDARAGASGINPEEAVSACHGYCFAIDDSVPLTIARSTGNNVKAIWAEDQRTPFGFATCAVTHNPAIDSKCKSRTGKNITSPRQWKGLRIAYQANQLYLPEVMLGSVGLSIKDITPVVVGFDTAPLTSGAVDAFDVFINNEVIALRLQHVHINVLPAYKFGMGAFYSDILVAPDSELKAHPAFVRKFVAILDRAWHYALAHPKAVADMVVKYYFPTEFGVPSNKRQQELELKMFATTLARDRSGKITGRMTLARWKQIVHVLSTYPASLGGRPLVTNPVDPKSLFTNAFAP